MNYFLESRRLFFTLEHHPVNNEQNENPLLEEKITDHNTFQCQILGKCKKTIMIAKQEGIKLPSAPKITIAQQQHDKTLAKTLVESNPKAHSIISLLIKSHAKNPDIGLSQLA